MQVKKELSSNKHIIEENVCQVDYLPELYEDARSEKYENICNLNLMASNTDKKVKVKFHPRTGHEGAEGEWRYSFALSLTSALDGGGCSTPHLGRCPR
jgi:hypothetical protein